MQNKKIYYAPVHLMVYDRPFHFIKCVESLKKNIGASETTLFISSDGPKDEKSFEKVKKVRKYINNLSGFKRVIVYAPKDNTRGCIKTEVRDKVREFSDRYIVSEDDNIFSCYFLRYMNNALEYFKEDEKIQDISGYMYPGFPSYQLIPVMLKAHTAWGVGFWREKDICHKIDQKKYAIDILKDKELYSKINNGNPHLGPTLKKIADGHLLAGDAIRTAILFKYDRYGVFPSISLVRNIGHDGSGEHGGITNKFINQKVHDEKIDDNIFKNTVCEVDHQKWIREYFGGKIGALRGISVYNQFNASNNISRKFWKYTIKGINVLDKIDAALKE